MLIACNNKGCLKTSEALLNPETKEVICQECGRPITNVTESMRRTLKSFGQIVREEKKAFMMACNNCKANREVALNEQSETICSICHQPIKVHAAMKLAMEAAGIKIKKIESKDEQKERPKIKTTRRPKEQKET